MTLKITISGVRGIFGESLTMELATKFGIAYGKLIKEGKVVIGSDTRASGPQVKKALLQGLISQDIEVVDVGILPTPSVQVLTRMSKAQGGVIITASHNPKQWNGIKFVSPEGIFLSEDKVNELVRLYESVSAAELAKANQQQVAVKEDKAFAAKHLEKVLELVDVGLIKNSGLKVVLDSCCGAGSAIAAELLKELGVNFIQINAELDVTKCRRGLEPIAENLGELSQKVKEFGADIGLAQDPDADRLAIVNEKGEAIGEDYTLCLISDYMLKLRKAGKMPGENAICTNLSTTRIIDDIAKKHGAKVIRTKIGEVNVSMAMKETNAVTGGEGNGGIMMPSIGYGRDSVAGIAFMLQYLAESKKKVSELVNENPRYTMYKTKIECTSNEQIKEVLGKVKAQFKNEDLSEIDGIKIVFKDGNWLHVRASNTEPIIRIISEAETLDKAKAIAGLLKL